MQTEPPLELFVLPSLYSLCTSLINSSTNGGGGGGGNEHFTAKKAKQNGQLTLALGNHTYTLIVKDTIAADISQRLGPV